MLLLVLLCGALHREAATRAWADDRGLADEPAWYQLSAPFWHAALPGSSSVAEALTSVVDPLTAASHGGDTRAIAALVAAATTGIVLIGLIRAAVPLGIAASMCIATVNGVLSAEAAVSITQALAALAAACLLLVAPSDSSPSLSRRLLLMGGSTVFGAAVHPAFLAFAAGVWIADGWRTTSIHRVRVLLAGAAAVMVGLGVAATMLNCGGNASSNAGVTTPGVPELAVALITGRFPAGLQPSVTGTWRDTLALITPVPLLLWTSIAAVGLATSRARLLEMRCAFGMGLAVLFAATTWLPDLAAAVAPATIALLVLAARGLTFVWHQPVHGARALTIAASVVIAASGFVIPRAPLSVEHAQMQAFVSAASEAAGTSVWSAERLATARALLQHDSRLAERRHAFNSDMLQRTDSAQSVITFTSEGSMRNAPAGLWLTPRPLTYHNARAFLAAHPETTWLAAAVRGPVAEDFCREVLDALGIDERRGANGAVALARLGRNVASVADGDRIDVPFGQSVPALRRDAPARFHVDARDEVKVVINGVTTARAPEGLVLGLFDRWYNYSTGSVLGSCTNTQRPAIDDRRLQAAYVVEAPESVTVPALPAVAAFPVDVPFTESGSAWFGPGWHGVEAVPMRWTNARDAHVYVVSARSQALRVRLHADLAARSTSNGLSLAWNGVPLKPVQPFSGEGEWVVPAAVVERGLNTLTIVVEQLVSPAAAGGSNDTRLLGAAVHHLSFAPIPDATAPALSTAPR